MVRSAAAPRVSNHEADKAPLPLQLDAQRALMRLHRGAEFCVVVDIKPRGVGQAERGRGPRIGAILALADALQRDALRAEADRDVGEILHDIVDKLAVAPSDQVSVLA